MLLTEPDPDKAPDPELLASADVKVSAPKLKGKYAAAEVQKAVNDRAADLRACYAKELSSDDGAHGVVTLTFTIGLYGNVTDVEASSDFSSDGMVQCLVTTFYELTFTRPDAEVKVTQALTFAKKG